MVKDCPLPFLSKTTQRYLFDYTDYNTALELLARSSKERKGKESYMLLEERVKWSLFAGDVIVHAENVKGRRHEY